MTSYKMGTKDDLAKIGIKVYFNPIDLKIESMNATRDGI